MVMSVRNTIWLLGLMTLSGCFSGPAIRFIVDVRPPVDRRQHLTHAQQDKGHPPVGKIRSEIGLKTP